MIGYKLTSFACVASDALNLLYRDYTNGFDECVGRLQRRLDITDLPRENIDN